MRKDRDHEEPGGFLRDLMNWGPAPTPQRELVVTVVAVVVFAVVLKMSVTPVSGVALGVFALYLILRWMLGIRRWSRKENL